MAGWINCIWPLGPSLGSSWASLATWSWACNPTYSLGSSSGDYERDCEPSFKYLLSPMHLEVDLQTRLIPTQQESQTPLKQPYISISPFQGAPSVATKSHEATS